IIQCALEHVTENGKVPELLNYNAKSKHKYGHPSNNRRICSAEKKSRVPLKKAKNKRGCSPNNRHICGAEEKENRVPLKKAKNNKMLHLNNIMLDICIAHNAVLEVHNPI
ncbi:44181_t:CDS:2, partial [Gigaspora margarita]